MHDAISELKRRARFIRYSVHRIGWRKLITNGLDLALDREAREHDSGFDARFGTETNTCVIPADAELPAGRREDATLYLPTMDGDLEAMLSLLDWHDELIAASTFIDVGSGKGRAVLLAAMQRRFREVLGVELSAPLHAIAEQNVERVRATGSLRAPVRLVHADAAAFAIPDGPLVLYLYHPFNETVADALVANVVASLRSSPRPAAILYARPMLQEGFARDVFARGDVFRKATDGGRATRSFRFDWQIWTNLAWLALPAARAA